MADESLHTVPLEHNIDYHIVTLFERLEALRKDSNGHGISSNRFSSTTIPKRSMHAEIRTLEFWRSIISECLASFFYVFIVCGAAAGAGVGASVSSVLLATALASGLAMATLTQCFLHISGAHINPAVTLAACVIRAISPIRAAMYVTAQCGGGIAGAALLYGHDLTQQRIWNLKNRNESNVQIAALAARLVEVCTLLYDVTVPGYQGNLQAAISHSATLAAWERFGVEFILTFIVVLSYFVSTDSLKKFMGNSAISIGAAYSACSFVSMPYLNPARSLGPSFVLNKWENHWVYWFGPLVGGICSAIIYEYIFNTRRSGRHSKSSMDNDSSSIHSEDDLNYDLDIEKPNMQNKYQGTYPRGGQPTGKSQAVGNAANLNGGNYCQNLYTAPPPIGKFEHPEPIYGGTRSMYCRSPTLTRTNLNRSQSVYAKSNTAINRDIVPRPGPLIPAQSLYPMRLQPTQQSTQSSHLQNQNVQNQLQQRSESIYGLRNSTRQAQQQQQQHQQHQHQQQQQHMHHQQQAQLQQNQHHHQQHQPQQQQQQQHQQQHQPHQAMQQPAQPLTTTQPATNQEHQQGFQPIYGTRQNPTPMDGNLKYDRRPESVYGHTAHRNRGQSAQSDDSSYGSYHGSAITPPARNAAGEPILMYVPPPHPQQGHTMGTAQPMRTQSERKVTAPVVVGQQQQQQQQQPPQQVPPATIAGTVTYTTNQPTTQQQQHQHSQQQLLAQHQQHQQQQQQQPQQHQASPAQQQQHQQPQHYGMLPLRSN